MYRINDIILYGIQGVCKIIDITEKEIEGKRREYYVLKPVYDSNSTIFIPVHSEKLVAKMRRILSTEEIYALIKAIPSESTVWIDNETLRREKYSAILTSGDRTALVRLIKTLYLHQKMQREKGRKLHVSDERFMKDAERMIYDEFAYVLHIKCEQVLPFILEQLRLMRKGQGQGSQGVI
ncbi:CarD family transcriptional regulator [Clostridium sp. BJN0013]|uniref:CarD family transcriptional regulator n=1 Tax=Clostridium sp. BJN0013 TaxID=3236840 RepID=UPI0034C68D0D